MFFWDERLIRYSRTVGIFYLYQLRVAIDRYTVDNQETLPGPDDFDAVFKAYGNLLVPGTWRQHYSEDFMQQNITQRFWRLPNLETLPDSYNDFVKKQDQSKAKRSLSNLEHKLPRFAFRVVKTYLTTDLSRVWVMEQALSVLQQTTIRSRLESKQIEMYSETQAYFWMTHMHSILIDFDKCGLKDLCFEHVVAKGLIDTSVWRKHYSESRWTSIESRASFQKPDIQPLHLGSHVISPEFITGDLEQAVQRLGLMGEIPSDEELALDLVIAMRQVQGVYMDKLDFKLHSHILLWLCSKLGFFERRCMQPIQVEEVISELRSRTSLSKDSAHSLVMAVFKARSDPLDERPKQSEKVEERNEMFRQFLVANRELLVRGTEEEIEEKVQDIGDTHRKEDMASIERQHDIDEEEMKQSIYSEMSKASLDDLEDEDITDSKTWEVL
jgi:hypothetical protein